MSHFLLYVSDQRSPLLLAAPKNASAKSSSTLTLIDSASVFWSGCVCVRGNNSRELDAEELDFRIGRIVPEHI